MLRLRELLTTTEQPNIAHLLLTPTMRPHHGPTSGQAAHCSILIIPSN